MDFVPRSPLNVVQMPAKANSGRSSLRANHITTRAAPTSGRPVSFCRRASARRPSFIALACVEERAGAKAH
jgi:hypothetical protein